MRVTGKETQKQGDREEHLKILAKGEKAKKETESKYILILDICNLFHGLDNVCVCVCVCVLTAKSVMSEVATKKTSHM